MPSTIVLKSFNDVNNLRKGNVVLCGKFQSLKSLYNRCFLTLTNSCRKNASADALNVNKDFLENEKKFKFFSFLSYFWCISFYHYSNNASNDVESNFGSLEGLCLCENCRTVVVKLTCQSNSQKSNAGHLPTVSLLKLDSTDSTDMFLILLLRCGDVARNPGPDQALPRDDVNATAVPDPSTNDVLREVRHDDQQNVQRVKGKSELQVVSLNVRGLGDRKKVRHLVNSCYKLSKASLNSIFLLQETYVVNLDLLRYLWRGEFHLTAGNGNSLGCVTLVTAPYKIVKVTELGQRGHVLALSKDDLNKVDLIVANVYAPNGFDREKRQFFDDALDAIVDAKTTYDCENVILGGDLNVVLNEDEVRNRAYSSAERRLADELKVNFSQSNLTDCWQKVKLHQPCYTWNSNRSGQPSFSTLDRILFTESQLSFKDVVADWSLSISDHAAVIASFTEIRTRRHNAILIPRLDPRLLLDQEGKTTMDEVFREMFDQRSANWDPHVSLEYLKLCIRTAANAAVGIIKARYRDEELSLNQSINLIISALAKNNVGREERELLMHKLDDLRQLKRSLVERIGAKLERKTARKWYNEGELSNKYFFNLMNRKSNDEINVLLSDNGAELKEPHEIEAKIRDFYRHLYEDVPKDLEDNDVIFRNIEPVSPEMARTLEERLTVNDLEKTLATCADSAPGPDGIPYSYLKHFWADVGPCLVRSWNHSLDTNQLPPSHKISYLRLIPKAGKDRRVIGNLRPITLSNTDHKLITKSYATKLTEIVKDKIGAEQTAYIPGRLINDNVRSMLATIDLANLDRSVDGMVVSLDAKKAFDSVDHNFIRRCLKAFGLDGFIRVFDTLYKDLRSDIIINGRTINGYQILKGVKQGDALSCILFVLCIEPLIRNIKQNPNIEPIESNSLPIRIPKVYGYADDVTAVAKRTFEGMQSIFTEYEAFTKSSGLVLNADKTDVLTFNNAKISYSFDVNYLGVTHRLAAVNEVKINGILLLQDSAEREARNVAKVAQAMEGQLLNWSTRNLTLIGKILIIKTFAISQVIYLLQTMSLSEASFNLINKIVYKYLWNRNYRAAKAPDRIKREVMMTPLRLGGFGMMDIKELADSLDLRSYGRLITSDHPFFKQVSTKINANDFFNVTVNVAVDRKVTRSLLLVNANRSRILEWTVPEITSNSVLSTYLLNMPVAKLISGPGQQSLHYFAAHRRVRNPKIRDLNVNELRALERYLIKPALTQTVRALLNLGPRPAIAYDEKDLYVTNSRSIQCISTMSSKNIRLNQTRDDEKIICLYKIGMALDPGEVMGWTSIVKKLTSTRHKNILLRTAHGDIYSNARLHKFRLRDNSGCANCAEAVESIKHRITECTQAQVTWMKVNEAKAALGMNVLTDFTIENLLGAKDRLDRIELAINAEIIHRLTSNGEGYCPNQVVKASLQLIRYSENLEPSLKVKLKEYIERV